MEVCGDSSVYGSSQLTRRLAQAPSTLPGLGPRHLRPSPASLLPMSESGRAPSPLAGMAFLKRFFQNYANHKKLSDEWSLTAEQQQQLGQKKRRKETEEDLAAPDVPGSPLEGITFCVRYLGSTEVREPSSPKATARAINTVLNNSKSAGKKPVEVQLAVNLRGVSVYDLENKIHLMDVSLYRISYCSADAIHGHVFAFIAINDNEQLECHAFLCPKRKIAQLMSITVAQTFNTAFHLWQMTHTGSIPASPGGDSAYINGCSQKDEKPSVLQTLIAPVPVLIDLTSPFPEKQHIDWTSFDD